MTAVLPIQPQVEPYFHEDSYGYRPNRSAHDAIAKAQERCWQYAWVLDMDISHHICNECDPVLQRFLWLFPEMDFC